ncbi:MAG: InlB B-repeat-containing protein, partial [Clostridiales bacterium]|nr:InlB B-repeat-containing protein [Clostridiales bacterium]
TNTPTAKNYYTVTFNADDGTLNGAATLDTNTEGFVQGTIPTAAKDDTTFRGWALTIGANESAVINFTTYAFDKDRTVYAVYKAYDVVTITYDYGEGSGTRGSDKTVNGKLADLPTPSAPAGKKFDGWYTAETDGTKVTADTVFTQAGTIYARYTDGSVEYTNYCLVGTQKIELEEVTLEDAAQAFTVTANLQANDTVKFYVNGQLISATKGSIWLGMKPSTGKRTEFAAERAGAFEFNLTLSKAATPAWTVTGDDGTAIAIKDEYYLVGEGEALGNWKCIEVNHLGTTSGGVQVTVGATTPATFKVVKAKDRMGAPNWDSGALGSGNMSRIGIGYVSTDNDGNIVLKTAGHYTIKLVDGMVQITSTDVPEPQPTKDIAGYTYGAVDSSKYYLVGGFIGEDFDGNTGYEMKTKTNDAGDTEYMVEGFTVEAGGAVKIVFGGTSYGYENIHPEYGQKNLATTDDDGNIVFKAFGTYKIYLNPTTGAIYLSR